MNNRLIGFGMGLVVSAVSFSGCSSLDKVSSMTGFNGIGDAFEVACTDHPVNPGSVSHPNIVPFSTNRIVVTYFPSESAEGCTGKMGVDWPAYSDDEGKTWQFGDPFTWLDGPPNHAVAVTAGQVVAESQGHYGYFFGFTVMSNQHRYASEFWLWPKNGRYLCRGVTSTGGNEWNGPFEVEYKLPAGLSPVQLVLPARGIETQDGKLGMIIYGQDTSRKYLTFYFTSSDGGRSFDFVSTVATTNDCPWGELGPCEPAIVQLESGELLCIMRTGSGAYGSAGTPMLEARSTDNGITWKHRKITLGGVLPKIIQTKNKRMYMLFGRPGNELAISRNEGRSWSTIGSLSPADAFTSGYADGMEISNGRLLVVFDRWKRTRQKVWLWEPPPPVNCVMGRYVDIN